MTVLMKPKELRARNVPPVIQKVMNCSYFEAMGMLGTVWDETQNAELHIVSPEQAEEVLGIYFDDPQLILGAMCRAQIATRVEGGILIHGNREHVERLKEHRKRAKDASDKAKNKRTKSGKLSVYGSEHGTEHGSEHGTVEALPARRSSLHGTDHGPCLDPNTVPCGPDLRADPPLHGDQWGGGEVGRDPSSSRLRSKEEGGIPPTPQTPANVHPLHHGVSAAIANELADEWRSYLAEHRSRKSPLIHSPAVLDHARAIYVAAGCDLRSAKLVIRRYIAEDRDFWESAGWSLRLLAQPGDFDRAWSLMSRDLAAASPG